MFNNAALDVFIGLVFVFLLYSLLATIVQEIIATRFDFRAKVLEKAILRMLEDGKTPTGVPYMDRMIGLLHIFNLKSLMKDKKVAPWFYAHPLVKYLAEDNWYSKPAYISATNFSKVMMDLLKGYNRPESQAIQAIHESITSGTIHKLPINLSDKANPAIKYVREQNPAGITAEQLSNETVDLNTSTAFFLRTLWQDAGADPEKFKTLIEQWFDDTMKRATGWYKKYTRIVLFVIGCVLAYSFNVDTIAIHRILSTNETARNQMVQMAIANREHLDPGKILPGDSSKASASLLDSTYKLVAADAKKSNDILGLGTPWKDTCKMYKKLQKDTTYKKRFDSLQNIQNRINDSVVLITGSITLHLSQISSTSGTANSDAINKLKQQLVADSSTLKQLQAKRNPEFEKMIFLKERCAYIKEMRAHKWFRYSPNQSGGAETFIGWLITAFAVMLGAPFWFDLLSKLISLRGVGVKESAKSNSGNDTTTASTTNPVVVNVNSNPGEEAVG